MWLLHLHLSSGFLAHVYKAHARLGEALAHGLRGKPQDVAGLYEIVHD